MSLTLYSNYVNSAGERVRIALALKGIKADYISVSEIGRRAYAQVNPQGLVPALRIATPEGDHIVQQSTAILEWLEETYPEPQLLPTDPILRAQSRGFAQAITSEMHAIDVIRIRRFLADDLEIPKEKIDRWQEHWFTRGFTALEELLARRETTWPFCFGDQPGWADLHLIPQVRKGLTRFAVGMQSYPRITGIWEACKDLPEFVSAAPENQPDWPGQIVEPVLPPETD